MCVCGNKLVVGAMSVMYDIIFVMELCVKLCCVECNSVCAFLNRQGTWGISFVSVYTMNVIEWHIPYQNWDMIVVW